MWMPAAAAAVEGGGRIVVSCLCDGCFCLFPYLVRRGFNVLVAFILQRGDGR